jgi:single-strand DNA-binding protein
MLMSDLNVTTITGRLVRDPILRRTANDVASANFTIATNYAYKGKDGNRTEEVAFVPARVFGGWADAMAKHSKGETVVASGRLRTETWQKDGVTKSQLTLICDSVHFFAPAKVSAAPEGYEEAHPAKAGSEDDHSEAPPF